MHKNTPDAHPYLFKIILDVKGRAWNWVSCIPVQFLSHKAILPFLSLVRRAGWNLESLFANWNKNQSFHFWIRTKIPWNYFFKKIVYEKFVFMGNLVTINTILGEKISSIEMAFFPVENSYNKNFLTWSIGKFHISSLEAKSWLWLQSFWGRIDTVFPLKGPQQHNLGACQPFRCPFTEIVGLHKRRTYGLELD